jgi:catechol 2,3-dioxygenase-like lactoylglutathione lyase family enzyme
MLDHVSITVSDIAAAERFYDAIMKVLGVVKVGRRDDWLGYDEPARPVYPDRIYISIRKGPKPEEAVGRHWCFKTKWRKQVDAFWDAGMAAGGSDDGPLGLRNFHASYYAAFLRGPHGNRIEVVRHHSVRPESGLLKNFESFSPYRQGSSAALVMPIRMPATMLGFSVRACSEIGETSSGTPLC